MKKLLILMFAFLMSAGIAVSARDNVSHDISVLPQAAANTISKNFKAKFSFVKIDREFGRVHEYEVVLSDGSEITFDSKGNWKDIEAGAKGQVPSGFIPTGVQDYVKANHKGSRIVGIEKDRRGYDVELSNGIDMKFSTDGSFIKYD